MRLNDLKDNDLLFQTKTLIKKERELLTKILAHLREIDRRKLYCDLGYGSLFEYAVKELNYSEGQAGRRIQAMRLIKEIPQVEKSIAKGELSLSNVSQAQSLFKTLAKEEQKPLKRNEKMNVLNHLKNKSTRDGQKALFKLHPQACSTVKEKERAISDEATELKLVINDALKQKLEKVRTLLGVKGAHMSYAELLNEMATLSIDSLEKKKFGKKRVETEMGSKEVKEKIESKDREKSPATTAPEERSARASRDSKSNRYLSKNLQHQVWRRDKGACTNCGGTKLLNIDHIKPVALGGESHLENLRLLCFQCNQRAAIKVFGKSKVRNRSRGGGRCVGPRTLP